MTEAERNKQLVREFFDTLNRGDGDAMVDMFADDGTSVTMGTTPISGVHTVADMRKSANAITGVFPDRLKFNIHGLVAEGAKVAAEAESHGRHVSGAIYNNHYHFLFTFRDGKVLEFKEYMDTQQLNDVIFGGMKPKS